mmetsp:Transcript_78962/g.199317  ORF Transcript_78962/g.199317 Transcript_78962/m.199317 type:complete len:365 (+) Transcript_78962:132-1226(+)
MAKVLMMGNKPGRENWVKDTSASTCQGCKAPFSLFKRRHHCRACGNVFCKDCSSFEIGLHRDHYDDGVEKQKRVCAWCFKSLARQRQDLERRGHARPEPEEELLGCLSSLRLRDEDILEVPAKPALAAAEKSPLRPTLLAPPNTAAKPIKASHFEDIVQPELAPAQVLPKQASAPRPPSLPPSLLTPSSVGARPFKASCFDEVEQPMPTLPQVPVSPALPAAPAPKSPSFPALSPDAALPVEETGATLATPRSWVEEEGPSPGDTSEFCGPQWEAFSTAYPAAAAAFQNCAEALSDPKAWENKAEITIKALRLHVLKVPDKDLQLAPGKTQVVLFANRLEARRPLYRRQTAEIREKLAGRTSFC